VELDRNDLRILKLEVVPPATVTGRRLEPRSGVEEVVLPITIISGRTCTSRFSAARAE